MYDSFYSYMVSRAIDQTQNFFFVKFFFSFFNMSATANGVPPVFTDTITTNAQTLLTINMSNVSKLTAANYLMWSVQIHELLDGYDY